MPGSGSRRCAAGRLRSAWRSSSPASWGRSLLVGSVATSLGLGFDAPWYLAQLAAVGYIRFPTLLVAAAWIAVAAQLTAIVSRRYAPYPTAAERGRRGPIRTLVRRSVRAVGHRDRSEERQRAVGP